MAKRELTKDEQRVKELVANMSSGERVMYYVGTYKFHALAIIAAIALVIYVVYSILTAKDKILHIGIINKSGYCSQYMVDSYMEYAGKDANKELIALKTDLGTSADYYQGGYNLINMYTMTDELNLVFTDQEGLDFLGKSGIVAEPEYWMDEELYTLLKDNITNMTILADTTDMSENPEMAERPLCIDISGTRIMEAFGLDDDTHYMVCVIVGKYADEIKGYCRYLAEIEKGAQPLNYTPPIKNENNIGINIDILL